MPDLFVYLSPEDLALKSASMDIATRAKNKFLHFGKDCFKGQMGEKDRDLTVTFAGHGSTNSFGEEKLTPEDFLKSLETERFPFQQVSKINLLGCGIGHTKDGKSFHLRFAELALAKYPHLKISSIMPFTSEKLCHMRVAVSADSSQSFVKCIGIPEEKKDDFKKMVSLDRKLETADIYFSKLKNIHDKIFFGESLPEIKAAIDDAFKAFFILSDDDPILQKLYNEKIMKLKEIFESSDPEAELNRYRRNNSPEEIAKSLQSEKEKYIQPIKAECLKIKDAITVCYQEWPSLKAAMSDPRFEINSSNVSRLGKFDHETLYVWSMIQHQIHIINNSSVRKAFNKAKLQELKNIDAMIDTGDLPAVIKCILNSKQKLFKESDYEHFRQLLKRIETRVESQPVKQKSETSSIPSQSSGDFKETKETQRHTAVTPDPVRQLADELAKKIEKEFSMDQILAKLAKGIENFQLQSNPKSETVASPPLTSAESVEIKPKDEPQQMTTVTPVLPPLSHETVVVERRNSFLPNIDPILKALDVSATEKKWEAKDLTTDHHSKPYREFSNNELSFYAYPNKLTTNQINVDTFVAMLRTFQSVYPGQSILITMGNGTEKEMNYWKEAWIKVGLTGEPTFNKKSTVVDEFTTPRQARS